MDLKSNFLNSADRTWHLNWLRMRETGLKVSLGYGNKFSKFFYSSMVPYLSWEGGDSTRNSLHGGVFNLEFSPDGSLLVAACEKRSFLMFDALSQKQVHAVENAHRDCVNCVRFLDSRTFVTCSDDSTVALWDARNLKSSIRTLHGHSNWVKNIEYSQNDGLLITSGFDGSIYSWDINSYTENGFTYERVFHTNGLMRTRLTPDSSKMIICTTGGYLMIIHDLNLRTLAQDLHGFKPNMYRLMQQSQTTIPSASVFTSLFSKKRKRNRIEFVSDFPTHNDAEVVSSLQIHPQGWCALSRNISHEELSEWTCVHDIQDRDDEDSMTENEDLLSSLRDDSDDVMYDDEDGSNERRGFRGFPNPNHNSGSDEDVDSEEWSPPGRRILFSGNAAPEGDGSDSSSSSDSEVANPRRSRRAVNPPQSRPPAGRRPANRTGGPAEEVNSRPAQRRGGNIRRMRISVDGQVQVSDDESAEEPAANVRVVDAQQPSRSARPSRATPARARSRYPHRSTPVTSQSPRLDTTESPATGNSSGSRALLASRIFTSRISSTSAGSAASATSSSTSSTRSSTANSVAISNSPTASRSSSSSHAASASSAASSPSASTRSSVTSPVSSTLNPRTSPAATSSSDQVSSQPTSRSPLTSAASGSQDAARTRPTSGSNETANAAAAVGAARQARGNNGNMPLSQNMELHVASPDFWEALVWIREARARRQQGPNRNASAAGRDRRELIHRFLRRLYGNSSDGINGGGDWNNSDSSSSGNAGSSAVTGNGSAEAGSSSSMADRPRRVFRMLRQSQRQGQAPAAIALGNFLRNPTPATRTLIMIAPHQGGAQNIHLRVSPNSYSYQSQQLKIPRNHKIHQNIRRLSHYIEEPNVGKGFIKELCFSSDGRVMCSPFSYGIRLLSFSPDCQEISTSMPSDPPVRLYEVSERMCHDDYVLSSKFSPTHCLLVSGCLKGKIVWHQPHL